MNGHWIENGNSFPVFNPATGEKIADVTDLGVEDVTLAIDGAYDAKLTWAAKTGKERGMILRKWHDLMVENIDDLATILTAEMGKASDRG